KVMELQPIGPVVFIDTAGIDDIGALGKMRVEQSKKVVERTDIAIIVSDKWQDYEEQLYRLFRDRGTPVIAVANKSDLRADDSVEASAKAAGVKRVVSTNALNADGMEELKAALIDGVKESPLDTATLVDGLVDEGDVVILVTPVDIESPRGRMLLAQVQAIREVLDKNATAIVAKEDRIEGLLKLLKEPPQLVVTDSQAFDMISKIVPDSIPLTSFSILFARFKGDLKQMVDGAKAIGKLKSGDKVLIAEACTHHPIGEDIGRVKLPRWLREFVGDDLNIDIVAGRDFPDDISPYKVVIHCGACVWNKQQVLSRLAIASNAGVAFTNYGLAIAYSLGVFDRALKPFPELA
ncbi:MAG: [FeFe] hydrogenase H-cluster maturation GTPase HydF, partial [Phycisphaerae bacterium]|nr:[FeFe] hydrogenase H-cluster maturation GTPase HydF [Phycisphaerae bacterium]